MNLLEKWKNLLDRGKSFGALFTDLLKAFDFLNHELLQTSMHVGKLYLHYS